MPFLIKTEHMPNKLMGTILLQTRVWVLPPPQALLVDLSCIARNLSTPLGMYPHTIHPIGNLNFPLSCCRPPNSDRSLEPSNPCQALTSQDQRAGVEVDLDADKPLTLSQLSAHKVTPSRDPTPTPRDSVPISPLRLPTKRSISGASNVLQKRKKSKIDTSSADVSVPKTTAMPKTRQPATKKYSKVPKPISSSNSSSGMRFNRSIRRNKVNGPRIKRLPVFKAEVPRLDAGDNHEDMGIATSASSSMDTTRASTSGLKNSNEKGSEPVNSLTLNNKGNSIASSSHGSSRVVRVIFHLCYPVVYWPALF